MCEYGLSNQDSFFSHDAKPTHPPKICRLERRELIAIFHRHISVNLIHLLKTLIKLDQHKIN